jgi:isopentenyl-diphosphate Delta-isomerase
MSMKDIFASTQSHPHKYTAWFCIAFPQVYKWWQSQQVQVV